MTAMEEKQLILKVVTPSGAMADIACDSVIIPLADDNGGGSAGIRKGHIAARFAICCGDILAKAKGEILAKVSVAEGFAMVEQNVVTVITQKSEYSRDDIQTKDK